MKRTIIGIAAVVVVIIGYFTIEAVFTKVYDIPLVRVKRGEMLIVQKVVGEVNAARAYTISAPRIRGLQITMLAPEGSAVEIGDIVIQFDATKQMADLTDHQSSLKIDQTTLSRSRQEYEIQKKNLELELQRSQRKYDEKKHDAPRLAEEARLEMELAELNYKGKLDQLTSDVEKAELEVQRARDRVKVAQHELEQLSITAPIPGMVVYLEIWKGGSMDKVQEGDSPWPGQGLINIPDLSEMIVEATVSEVDAAKVDSGQVVIVTLDALPGREFAGEVKKKSTLARRKEPGSKINVFDVEISVLDYDPELKPGMSASARVIIDRLPDVVMVPLEAVFEKNNRTVVYKKNRKEIEVTVGRRSDLDIEIVDGLNGDEMICLADPTLDEQGLPGDLATEPELNEGRQQPPKSGGRRGRRGR